MRILVFICVFFFFSCTSRDFLIKEGSKIIGFEFFVFIETTDKNFNGKGEAILSENSFKCKIKDVFFDKTITTIFFDSFLNQAKVYLNLEGIGYTFQDEEIVKVLTSDFYNIITGNFSFSSLQKEFYKNENKIEILINTLKRKNNIPCRIAFNISQGGKKEKIIFDITKFNDKIKIEENNLTFIKAEDFNIIDFLASFE